MAHPTAGDVQYIASPLRFDNAAPPDATRPPRLGEHTLEILSDWLALDSEAMNDLAELGAFGVLKHETAQ